MLSSNECNMQAQMTRLEQRWTVGGEEERRYRLPPAWRSSAELWVLCSVENFSVVAASGPVCLPEQTDAEQGKHVSALKVFILKQ